MMKIFLDTNIWIRHFVQDSPESAVCTELIARIEQGQFRCYISNIVLMECMFVLEKLYSVPADHVQEILESILSIRNITLIEETDSRKALECHKQFGIKYADCLIALQVPDDGVLISYDRDFDALNNVQRKTPNEIVGYSG